VGTPEFHPSTSGSLGLGSPRRPWHYAESGVLLAAAGVAALYVRTGRLWVDDQCHVLGHCAVVLGATLLLVGGADLVARRRLRTVWSRRGTAPWHGDSSTPSAGYRDRTWLRSSSDHWNWLLKGLGLSAIAFLVLDRKSSGGLLSLCALLAYLVTQAIVVWNRRAYGRVTAEVRLPDPPLAPGRTGEVVFVLDPEKADLPPESFRFALRCSRSRPDSTLVLAPLAVSVAHGAMPAWTLTFAIPAEAHPSDLMASTPTKWDLVVEAKGPDVAYQHTLTVPVVA
jgi:hypothetical protein